MLSMRTLPILLLLAALARGGDALDSALSDLRAAATADRAAAVEAVLALHHEIEGVLEKLRAGPAVEPIEPGWHKLEATDEKGVARPFFLELPKSVAKSGTPAPLLVYLHGGVSRPTFADDPGGYAHAWAEAGEEAGFVSVFPMGKEDCTWWSDAGVRHIRAVIREAKRIAPIDDDAIVATGFSDGGSGAYYLAMAAPTPFAAFLAQNGHPAVASGASGKQLYLRDLKLRPLFAAMTADDPLYPAFAVLQHLQPLLAEGADKLRLVSYETGGHRPSYFEDQRGAFLKFVTDTPRDPLPDEIDWWCADPATGKFAWVEVTEIGPGETDAKPLPDLNIISRPGKVRIGIQVDRNFQGPGVKVAKVMEKTTAAAMGIEEGDILVGLDKFRIADLPALSKALGKKHFDENVTVIVRRGDKELTLTGHFPAFMPEPYYKRDKPTARISVRHEGDAIEVTARNVRAFRLLIDPRMVDITKATVSVNGRPAETRSRRYDLKTILRRYGAEADKGRLFTGEIDVRVPAK